MGPGAEAWLWSISKSQNVELEPLFVHPGQSEAGTQASVLTYPVSASSLNPIGNT